MAALRRGCGRVLSAIAATRPISAAADELLAAHPGTAKGDRCVHRNRYGWLKQSSPASVPRLPWRLLVGRLSSSEPKAGNAALSTSSR